VRLRAAQPRDLDAVCSLEQELFGVDAWSVGTVALELARDPGTGVGVVALEAEECVGYAFASIAGGTADLDRIAVVAHSRRRRVGTALLDAVVERVRGDGCDRLLLEVADTNTAARELYLSRGFCELSRRRAYYRSHADALVLGLELRPRPRDGPTSENG
jgi:[ribosomal protein S18]-alanine N-acetyltransferase